MIPDLGSMSPGAATSRLVDMIQMEHVTKRYGSFTAVDDATFQARPGSVVGFLGPNGAGKSTALRILTGLTPPTSGTATILGKPYRELSNPGRQVGVMLDATAQHAGRTGRETLRLAAAMMGLPRGRVEDVMDLVGLTEAEGGRRTRHYSLGMRQRLGLAVALMGDPAVLILDEPVNGLDPQGIAWMRHLLRGFADQGGTVLLSSHLLHEIQVLADDIIMIGHGRIVMNGPKAEVMAAGRTRVNSLDNDRLLTALSAAGHRVEVDGEALVVTGAVHEVGRIAISTGVVLTDLRAGDESGLEDAYFRLTQGTDRGQAPTAKGVAA